MDCASETNWIEKLLVRQLLLKLVHSMERHTFVLWMKGLNLWFLLKQNNTIVSGVRRESFTTFREDFECFYAAIESSEWKTNRLSKLIPSDIIASSLFTPKITSEKLRLQSMQIKRKLKLGWESDKCKFNQFTSLLLSQASALNWSIVASTKRDEAANP